MVKFNKRDYYPNVWTSITFTASRKRASLKPSWHLACQADPDWWTGQELSTVLLKFSDDQGLEKGLSRLKDFQAHSQTVQTLIYTSCLSFMRVRYHTTTNQPPPPKKKKLQRLPQSTHIFVDVSGLDLGITSGDVGLVDAARQRHSVGVVGHPGRGGHPVRGVLNATAMQLHRHKNTNDQLIDTEPHPPSKLSL